MRAQCFRLVQRQHHKLSEAVLLLYSQDRIELYGEDMARVPASVYRSSKYHAAVVSSLGEVSELVVVAGERPVQLLLTLVRSPLRNPFPVVSAEEGVRVASQQETVLIESCEGWRPVIGLGLNEQFKELVEWRAGDCYIELEDYSSYSEWFAYNWTVVRNLIVFSLFCSHVLAAYSYRRYYTSLLVNLFLLLFLLRKLYLFENMVITSTATLIELLAAALLRLSHWLHVSPHYYLVVLLLPLASELLALVRVGVVAASSGTLLLVQLLLVNQEAGYLVALLKAYFMLDIYATQQPCVYSLALLAAWQASHMPGSPLRFATPLARAKGRLADALFLAMLCFSLA